MMGSKEGVRVHFLVKAKNAEAADKVIELLADRIEDEARAAAGQSLVPFHYPLLGCVVAEGHPASLHTKH